MFISWNRNYKSTENTCIDLESHCVKVSYPWNVRLRAFSGQKDRQTFRLVVWIPVINILNLLIAMNANKKTDNRFNIGFLKPITGLPKNRY